VQSHGPGDTLATRLMEQVRSWHEHERPATERLRVTAYRADAPLSPGEGIVLQKRWTQLVLAGL
jgi:hypothetical protein